jgi:hypothetical protein
MTSSLRISKFHRPSTFSKYAHSAPASAMISFSTAGTLPGSPEGPAIPWCQLAAAQGKYLTA